MNQKESLKVVELYTDGACSGNPGPGGWAFILRCPRTGKELERSDGTGETTNNAMELTAVLKGLEALKEPCHVKLFADSVYVGKGMSEWLAGWKKKGWKRSDGGKLVEIKNRELWVKLDALMQVHRIEFVHVKGHAGHVENERCDQLAVAALQPFKRQSFK